MAKSMDAARVTPITIADAVATPLPPAKLYDAARNKQWGVVTLEDIEAEFRGNQEALAARIRQNKATRHKRAWTDSAERASDGVMMKVLQQSLKGTKQSTETMVRMTGYAAPTTQQRIQLAEFFVWAAPELRAMWERSQTETEPGKGVRDFEMPPDRIIIEMGQAAAKKAGCWGLPQMLLIASGQQTVEAQDLPKAIGWDPKRRPPYPHWEDKGPLVAPWQDFRLYLEVPEAGRDLQPAWSLDLFVHDGEPVTFHQRGFVVRSANGVFAGAADVLGQFKPHVRFLEAQQVDEAAAADKTGKRHATLNEIADNLRLEPAVMVEHLHRGGYLNLQGEATPAALDDGITTLVDGGTQFCLEVIKTFLAKAAHTEMASEEAPVAPDQPTTGTDPNDGTIDTPIDTEADTSGEPNPTSLTPNPDFDPGDVSAPEANGKPPVAMPATRDVTVWRGGGMRQVRALPKDPPTQDAEPPMAPPGHGTAAGDSDPIAVAIQCLSAAEAIMGRRTEAGEFVPHPGDNQSLRDRMTQAAQPVSKAKAILATLKRDSHDDDVADVTILAFPRSNDGSTEAASG